MFCVEPTSGKSLAQIMFWHLRLATARSRDDLEKLSVLMALFNENLSVDSTHRRRGQLSVGVFIVVSMGDLLNSLSSSR